MNERKVRTGKFLCQECDKAQRAAEKRMGAVEGVPLASKPPEPVKSALAAKPAAAAPLPPSPRDARAPRRSQARGEARAAAAKRVQAARDRPRSSSLRPRSLNAPLKKLSELTGVAFDGVPLGLCAAQAALRFPRS